MTELSSTSPLNIIYRLFERFDKNCVFLYDTLIVNNSKSQSQLVYFQVSEDEIGETILNFILLAFSTRPTNSIVLAQYYYYSTVAYFFDLVSVTGLLKIE